MQSFSQAILCQTHGLAQMKKLPDLPKFCLVCLAGPAVNDNTAMCGLGVRSSSQHQTATVALYGSFINSVLHFPHQGYHLMMVHMSCLTTKPTKRHVRPAKTQISLGISPLALHSMGS